MYPPNFSIRAADSLKEHFPDGYGFYDTVFHKRAVLNNFYKSHFGKFDFSILYSYGTVLIIGGIGISASFTALEFWKACFPAFLYPVVEIGIRLRKYYAVH